MSRNRWFSSLGAKRAAAAALTLALAGGSALAPVRVAWAEPATNLSFTIKGGQGVTSAAINGYLLFKADVDDTTNVASNPAWNDAVKETVLQFLDQKKAQTGASATYGKWLYDQGLVSRNLLGVSRSLMSAADRAAFEDPDNVLYYIVQEINGSSKVSTNLKLDASTSVPVDVTAATSFSDKLANWLVDRNAPATTTATVNSGSTGTSLTGLTEGFWLFYEQNKAYPPTWTPVGGAEDTAYVKDINVLTLDKQVQEESNGTWGKVADEGIDNEVHYRLIGTLPKNKPTDKYLYTFEDTLAQGLTIANPATDVKVSYWPSYSTGTPQDVTSSFDVSCSGNVLTVSAKGDGLKDINALPSSIPSADRIVVEYTAKVNVSATMGVGTGFNQGLNINTAKLTYGPEDDPVTTTETTAAVAVWELDIVKVDKNDHDTLLDEAGFAIKYTDDAGKVWYVQENGTLKDASDAANKHVFTTESTTDDDPSSPDYNPNYGKIIVKLIDSGAYELEEVTAPQGYRKNSVPTNVTIKATKDQANGTVTSLTAKADNGATATADLESGIVEITIENEENPELPITGMTPNQLGTMLGMLLVVTGATTVVLRNRKAAREQ